MDACIAYITAGNLEEAKSIGRVLVEDRLAACVNILPGMISMYWWEGQAQHEEEVTVIAKTRADLADALTQRVIEVHSYSCPCVIILPIEGGNPAFLQWIMEETAEAPPTVA